MSAALPLTADIRLRRNIGRDGHMNCRTHPQEKLQVVRRRSTMKLATDLPTGA